MDSFDDLYEAPRRVAPEWGHHRLFAPESYVSVRHRSFIPVVFSETLTLATWFPTCWRRDGTQLRMGVLRSLLPDGRGHPVPPTHAAGALPLALSAYPLCARAPEEAGGLWVDPAIPDAPTDAGAPLLLDDGRPSRAVEIRARMIARLQAGWPLTRALTLAFEAAGLFEPWPLDFDLGHGVRAGRDDLLVVSAARLGDPIVPGLVRELGAEAALFMAAHRLSLFRIADLLRAARAAVGPPARAAVA